MIGCVWKVFFDKLHPDWGKVKRRFEKKLKHFCENVGCYKIVLNDVLIYILFDLLMQNKKNVKMKKFINEIVK